MTVAALACRAGIRRYLRIIGITHGEVHAIRKNLLQPQLAGSGGVPPLGTLSAFSMGTKAGAGDDVSSSPSRQSAVLSRGTGSVEMGSGGLSFADCRPLCSRQCCSQSHHKLR